MYRYASAVSCWFDSVTSGIQFVLVGLVVGESRWWRVVDRCRYRCCLLEDLRLLVGERQLRGEDVRVEMSGGSLLGGWRDVVKKVGLRRGRRS